MKLPAEPKTPALLQTLQVIANPTKFLADSAKQYGEPFSVRVLEVEFTASSIF